jgi:hypothetical protein
MGASGLDMCGCGWGLVTVVGELWFCKMLGMSSLVKPVLKRDSAAWENLVIWLYPLVS